MAFIDEVVVRIHSGAGGDGCISFRREKYVPRGGPNGGNGGKGGSVLFVATRNKISLLDFKYQPIFRAQRGQHGMGKDMNGRAGEDLVIPVPPGTLIYDLDSQQLLHDLVDEEKPVEVAKGGRGGRGNKTFTTPTLRAPRIATPGEPGELMNLRLELRLLADVGLVGLPNAGKSSFLRVISRATPKVAEYPFTTLEPHLGVVTHKSQSYVVADLPGLIEGASRGAGLGEKFLRHATRNRILLHLVDVTAPANVTQTSIEIIRREMKAYDETLLDREELLIFTKTDLMSESELAQKRVDLSRLGLEGFFISNHTHAGISDVLDALSTRAQTWKIDST